MAKKVIKKQFSGSADAAENTVKLMEHLGAMSLKGSAQDVDVVCGSGSIALNKALGVGGYPKGRIVEIYGPESSGKTTLTLHAIAEAQKAGEQVLFVDAEHALDPVYAEDIGVNTETLLVIQPDSGEEALQAVQKAVETGEIGVIVVDSVAALTPQAEINGEIGDSHVGLQARMMSQALRKLTSIASKTGTTIFFINQIRMKIGIMFGSPETTTGGNALKFYASIRLDIRKTGVVKKGDVAISQSVKVKVVKNKVASPFKEAHFEIAFGKGIDYHSEIIDLAVAEGVVQKSGAWYAHKTERMGQGKENSVELLRNDPELLKKIISEISEKVGEEESKTLGIA